MGIDLGVRCNFLFLSRMKPLFSSLDIQYFAADYEMTRRERGRAPSVSFLSQIDGEKYKMVLWIGYDLCSLLCEMVFFCEMQQTKQVPGQ